MPLPGYVDALRAHLEPQRQDWFAYKMSEPKSQAAVARTLTARTGLDWDPADVAMTNGGFAAHRRRVAGDPRAGRRGRLPVAAVVLLRAADPRRRRRRRSACRSRRRPSTSTSTTIAAAITPRTRAVLVNTPHNPSGRVYPLDDAAGAGGGPRRRPPTRIGRPIYLVSDEPYNRIVFDGRDVPQPGRGLPEHDRRRTRTARRCWRRGCASAT